VTDSTLDHSLDAVVPLTPRGLDRRHPSRSSRRFRLATRACSVRVWLSWLRVVEPASLLVVAPARPREEAAHGAPRAQRIPQGVEALEGLVDVGAQDRRLNLGGVRPQLEGLLSLGRPLEPSLNAEVIPTGVAMPSSLSPAVACNL
jgi:hypothetical protein